MKSGPTAIPPNRDACCVARIFLVLRYANACQHLPTYMPKYPQICDSYRLSVIINAPVVLIIWCLASLQVLRAYYSSTTSQFSDLDLGDIRTSM